MRRFSFAFHCVDSLPRLAWCATLRAGDEDVALFHGSAVETRGDWFVEGAWNGPFPAGRFDEAHTLCGTGGRVGEAGALFCGPSHFYSGLFTLRVGPELFVSNSLAFVLARAGDDLDPRYPHYAQDLAEYRRRGLQKQEKTLRTRLGNQVGIHTFSDLRVSPDLSLCEVARPDCEAPGNFEEYRRLLEATLTAVFDNAGDASRKLRYRPKTMISRGYDSVAASALAARAGCREALTFAKLDPEDPNPSDGGAHIAAALGLAAREYDRIGFLKLSRIVEAEFCACPAGTGTPIAGMEEELEATLLVDGSFGDAIWHKDPREHPPELRRLRRDLWMTITGTACSDREFRLRVGYLGLPVPCIGARHDQRIQQISVSEEMKPWSIGGEYDRPIPRRIGEEAGVPREWFGQVKVGGLYYHFYKYGLTPNGREDFAKFYQTIQRPTPFTERSWFSLMRALYAANAAVVSLLNSLGDRFQWKTVFTPAIHSRYSTKVDPLYYSFHWGIDHVKRRYEIPAWARLE